MYYQFLFCKYGKYSNFLLNYLRVLELWSMNSCSHVVYKAYRKSFISKNFNSLGNKLVNIHENKVLVNIYTYSTYGINRILLSLQVAVLAQLNHPSIVAYRESFEGLLF